MASVTVSNIKQLLSEEVAAATKKLQRDHIGTDSAIRSGDTANRICNVLEAIFLHELKESYEVKAFWPFVIKFTHRDVCRQIEGLSQITTEVGRCRAWIRLALNDCLFESYIDAMLRDTKAVKQFYKRTAYIRDVEHPEILRKCVQGLSNFYFQLSLNSSVINMWGSSPKMLTGRWQPPIEIQQTSSPTLSLKSSDGSEESFLPNSGFTPKRKHRKGSSTRKTSSIPTPKIEDPNESVGEHSSFRECEMSSGLIHTPSEGSLSIDSNNEKNSGLGSQEGEEEHSMESHTAVDGNNETNAGYIKFEASGQLIVKNDSEPLNAGDVIESKKTIGDISKDVAEGLMEKLDDREVEYETETTSKTMAVDLTDDSIISEGAFITDEIENPYESQQQFKEDIAEADPPFEFVEESNEDSEHCLNLDKERCKKEEIFGNSLGARGGWSSQFENSSSSKTVVGPENGGSYTSLLNNYAENTAAKLLPASVDTEKLMDKIAPKGEERTSNDLCDDLLADYDIVLPIPSSTLFLSDPKFGARWLNKKVQQLLAIVTKISREKGLDAQNYQCKGCTRPIGIIYGKAKVCSYDGCYYCNECHIDEECVIPAKVLHNWDFRKHKVASYTKTFLQQVESFPLIDVSFSNPSLYDAITEVQDIKVLRNQLKYLKAYLFTCKQSTAEELKKKVWPREYMLDHAHLYSVQDFHQVQSGQLAKDLKRVINWAAKHVYNCILCGQKGFMCELCDSPKVIYPFDVELTTRCEICKTVYHKACRQEHQPCSKCTRIKQRRSQLRNPGEPVDFASPWS
ncbi:pleckstrin homology domain-containing family M member 1-like isoform X2 [Antedon mediterranea]|uniref:pleckstrin homology domain-containing family M member 1-like isoform X2 n=1 Tax=Antedon mediterranea TaxID=105859 RepID=UPI003AF9AFF1